ncbi:hypothetical protein, partial [Denitromonas iodatirespirans]|uniref:hypothetical protein n=1 Tax=Denitromonas iodatirespirans TaxID=2795389 RepID=UPI001BDC579B
IIDANIGPYRVSEWDVCEPLLASLAPDMLLMADRGFTGYLYCPLSQNSCRLDRIQNPGAMRRERSGSIRTKIQGQSARSTVAAGGRLSGSGFPGTEHFG